jgi:hypothetical protein
MMGRLFASFFGAAMIAGAFAYYNYKFSEFKFIDFSQIILYEKKAIFEPKEDEYLVIIYNSRDKISLQKLEKIKSNSHIIMIDFYQTIQDIQIGENNITHLKSGTNTFIEIVQKFNVYELPTLFFIKKFNRKLYKQDSDIYKLSNFKF